MKNSKLLAVLSAFDKKEMSRFRSFLQSPYFHQPKIATDEWQLFELLHKHHPSFPEGSLNKKKIFQQLYPDSPYRQGRLEKKMSALFQRMEHFMDVEEEAQASRKAARLLNISRFYRKKNLNRLYETQVAQLTKVQKLIPQKGLEDYLNNVLIQQEIADYQNLFNTRKKDLNLVNVLKSLDNYYLLSKLTYSCGLLSQRAFHNQVEVQDSLLFLEKLKPLLQSEAYTEAPMIRVYLQVFNILQKMQKEGTDDLLAYQELERLLQVHETELPLDALKAFHAFCRSFYSRQFNNGDRSVQDKLFNLYQIHLQKGYLFYEGGLTPGVFKNIVWMGLLVKQYDWVYTFLQDYQNSIVGSATPHAVYQLNLAHYYFHRQNYDQALHCLSDKYDDLYYQLAAKRLEIKIYFEEESDLLDFKINAFRLFLRRLSKKKLPEAARLANNNFINAILQILRPTTYKNPKRIKSLQAKVMDTAVIKEKVWLLEKLQE